MRRGSSNSRKLNATLPSSMLEAEATQMEERLRNLKEAMIKERDIRDDKMKTSGSRWKTATSEHPIKNYATKVLEKKQNLSATSTISKQGQIAATVNSKELKNSFPEKKSILKIGNLVPSEHKSVPTSQPVGLLRPPSNKSARSQLTSATASQKENVKFVDFNVSSVSSTSNQSETKQMQQQLPTSAQKPSQNQNRLNILVEISGSSKNNISEKPKNQLSKSLAESNLSKHIGNQKELLKEVNQFLTSVDLVQFQKVFEDNGFDDLETIFEINTENMNDMKIPANYQKRITKRIENLQAESKAFDQLHKKKSLTDSAQGNGVQESSKIKNILVQPRKIQSIQPISQQQTSATTTASVNTVKTIASPLKKKQVGGELLQGNFNEEESHNSFLEALMEFRGLKNKQNQDISLTDSATESKKTVHFSNETNSADSEEKPSKYRRNRSTKQLQEVSEAISDDGCIRGFMKNAILKQKEPEVEKQTKSDSKFSFFCAAGSSEWSNDQFPFQTDAEVTANLPETRLPRKDIDRISCYTCYKLVVLGNEKTFNIKNFCSTQCVASYKGTCFVTCFCGKQELKDDCVFAKAQWFCSEVCALDLNTQKSSKTPNQIKDNSIFEEEQEEIDLDFTNKYSSKQKLYSIR